MDDCSDWKVNGTCDSVRAYFFSIHGMVLLYARLDENMLAKEMFLSNYPYRTL